MAQLRQPTARSPVDSARRHAVVAAAAPLIVFAVLLVLVQRHWQPLHRLDGLVTTALHRYAVGHHTFVLAMKAVSALGTSASYTVLAVGLIAWLLRHGRVRATAFVVVSVAGGTVLNTLVKSAVMRPRPSFVDPVAHAGYSSFPSGHAQAVAVAVGVVLLLSTARPVRRRLTITAAVGWALLMAFSRVALGVHYLSDVLAGLALGAAWALGCVAAAGPTRVRGTRTGA